MFRARKNHLENTSPASLSWLSLWRWFVLQEPKRHISKKSTICLSGIGWTAIKLTYDGAPHRSTKKLTDKAIGHKIKSPANNWWGSAKRHASYPKPTVVYNTGRNLHRYIISFCSRPEVGVEIISGHGVTIVMTIHSGFSDKINHFSVALARSQ